VKGTGLSSHHHAASALAQETSQLRRLGSAATLLPCPFLAVFLMASCGARSFEAKGTPPADTAALDAMLCSVAHLDVTRYVGGARQLAPLLQALPLHHATGLAHLAAPIGTASVARALASWLPSAQCLRTITVTDLGGGVGSAEVLGSALPHAPSLTAVHLLLGFARTPAMRLFADGLVEMRDLRRLTVHCACAEGCVLSPIAAVLPRLRIVSLNLRAPVHPHSSPTLISDAVTRVATLTAFDAQLHALQLSPVLRHMPSLRVFRCPAIRCEDDSAEEIAAALPYASQLHTLALGLRNVGPGGGSALAAGLAYVTQLTSLELSTNGALGDSGVEKVLSALCKTKSGLKSLRLDRNGIGLLGAEALSHALATGSFTSLTSLSIAHNDLFDEGRVGGAALLSALPHTVPQLRALNLQATSMGPANADALAMAAQSLPQLRIVVLRDNACLTVATVFALHRGLANARLCM
jgi:hypothetical protein